MACIQLLILVITGKMTILGTSANALEHENTGQQMPFGIQILKIYWSLYQACLVV